MLRGQEWQRGERERGVLLRKTEMNTFLGTRQDWEEHAAPWGPKAGTRLGLSSVHARGLPVSSSPAVADEVSMTHSQLWA